MTSEGSNTTAITLRKPTKDDGFRLHQLVAECPPLDPNSIYCNLLQCSHFAETGVAAEKDGDLVGFISGYIPPQQPETVFVWQVAVDAAARGLGLGSRLLLGLLGRPELAEIRFLETTIGPDNRASWALFERLARGLSAEIETTTLFESQRHFDGVHADEILLRIGPFSAPAAS